MLIFLFFVPRVKFRKMKGEREREREREK